MTGELPLPHERVLAYEDLATFSQPPGTTLVADFILAEKMVSWRGKYVLLDNISKSDILYLVREKDVPAWAAYAAVIRKARQQIL